MSRPKYPKATSLKELKTRKSQLQTKLQLAQDEYAANGRVIRDLQNRLANIEHDIRSITTDPKVSEHAILRYMEHVMGVDLNMFREEIMDAALRKTIEQLGDGKYPIADNRGFAIVKNNVVVSVIPNGKSAKEIAQETDSQ